MKTHELIRGAPLLLMLIVSVFAPAIPSPAQGAILFGLVDTGELFSSTDDGATWNIHATLPVRDAVGIRAGSSSSELYLVSRTGSVYRSDDGGTSWDAAGAITASDVIHLDVAPNGDVLVLTETGGVYLSDDAGATFTAQGAMTASNHAGFAAVSEDTLYALTQTGEVSKSEDGGASWVAVGTIPVSDAENIVELNSYLYVITGTGGIYRSGDDGATWTPVGTLSQVHMTGFTCDGTNLFAATREGEVARSSDGVTWTWRGAINQLNVMALGTDTPAVSGVGDPPGGPSLFSLGQNYPNPFNTAHGSTLIPFNLQRGGRAMIRIYDASGRLVRTIDRGYLTPDYYRVSWNGRDHEGRDVPAGAYFYELSIPGGKAVKKMTLVR